MCDLKEGSFFLFKAVLISCRYSDEQSCYELQQQLMYAQFTDNERINNFRLTKCKGCLKSENDILQRWRKGVLVRNILQTYTSIFWNRSLQFAQIHRPQLSFIPDKIICCDRNHSYYRWDVTLHTPVVNYFDIYFACSLFNDTHCIRTLASNDWMMTNRRTENEVRGNCRNRV
jgi:hypothetical protein